MLGLLNWLLSGQPLVVFRGESRLRFRLFLCLILRETCEEIPDAANSHPHRRPRGHQKRVDDQHPQQNRRDGH